MRRCSSVLLLATALTAADLLPAQVLDLGDPSGAPPAPPALGLDTYAADLIRQLEQEMTDLAAGAEDGAQHQAVALASIKLRDVAARLLDQGDQAGPAGSFAVLGGVRLVRGRGDIDELLNRLLDSTDTQLDSARQAADAFNQPSLVWSTEPGVGAALDAALAQHLAPLAEVVRLLAPGETVDHWITQGAVRSSAGSQAAETLDDLLGRLAGGADATDLPEDARDALRRTRGFLERGAAFEQFRPQVRGYAVLLTEALALTADVQQVMWLDDLQRSTCLAIINAAIVRLADRETRDRGAQRLERLGAARDIIRRISVLDEVTRSAGPGRSRTGAPRIDMEPVTRAFGAVVMAAGQSSTGGPPQVDRLAGILDSMIAYRELNNPGLTRELRHAWRKLHDGYQRTEVAILEALPQLATSRGALSDPALASLVMDHRQYIEDLQRLEALPAWIEIIRAAAPRAAGPFGGRVRKLISNLGDPARRQEAVRSIDRLQQQMQSYFPMPFEMRLAGADRAAIIATGGLSDQLAAEIDRQRIDWARAWGAGTAGDAETRMDMLHELTSIMAGSARLLPGGDEVLLLNRWAAWELDPTTVARLVGDLTNRLKLATTAAVQGDDTGLRQQLDRIGANQARLVSTLLDLLEPELLTLPSGARSIIGQSVSGPSPDAWMVSRRWELADLCRYTMELEYARAGDRRQLADDLAVWIEGRAAALMSEITP